LGHGAVRTIAVHAAVGQVFSTKIEVGAFNLQLFWRKAVRGAQFGRLLAQMTGYGNPEEAYFAGLLRDLGQLVMLTKYPNQYKDILKEVNAVSELMLAEKNRFGSTHLEVAEQLIRRWRLTSFLPDAILYQHHPLEAVQGAHPLIKIINLATHLANRNDDKVSEPQADHGRSLFGLSQDDLSEIVKEVNDATQRAEQELGLFVVDKAGAADLGGASINDRLVRHVRTFTLLAAVNPVPGQATEEAALLSLTEQVRAGFGFYAPLAFLLDKERNCLTGYVLPGQSDLIGQLEIPLHGRSLPADSVQRREPLHSFDQTLHGRRSVIDEQIIRFAGGTGIFCMPLLHRGEVVGVIIIPLEEADVGKIEAERQTLAAFVAQAAQSIAVASSLRIHPDSRTGDAFPISQSRLRKIIHEVNNPLGIMKNYIKILSLKISKDDPAQFGLGVIDEEIDHIARIVGGLVETSETSPMIQEVVNVNLLIFDLVRITDEPLFIRDNIRLKTELDHAIKSLRLDRGKLKQVLVNLIKNAAEAMQRGGEIVISTHDEVKVEGSSYVQIAVTDNGPGIPAEILAHLFEPVTSTKGAEHFGLGLSIVNTLVNELGGLIRCSSDNKNGTRFEILLPYSSSAVQAQ
ncbi:MAG: HDOD domain-containing protein, partial [Burkholderiales bacterium]|nr:HDOD domain-containing protein [Burkholderiales bacterium]